MSMKSWRKKLPLLILSPIAVSAIVITPTILIESGYFQSNKNTYLQNNLIESLRANNIFPVSHFLASNNLNYEFICINGEYLSPNEVLTWQKNKMLPSRLELENIENIGYENYWSISLFDKSGKGELISIYAPRISISSMNELNVDSSCFSTADLYFRNYQAGTARKINTLDLIVN